MDTKKKALDFSYYEVGKTVVLDSADWNKLKKYLEYMGICIDEIPTKKPAKTTGKIKGKR